MSSNGFIAQIFQIVNGLTGIVPPDVFPSIMDIHLTDDESEMVWIYKHAYLLFMRDRGKEEQNTLEEYISGVTNCVKAAGEQSVDKVMDFMKWNEKIRMAIIEDVCKVYRQHMHDEGRSYDYDDIG